MKKLILIFITLTSYLQSDTITLIADEWCPYNCSKNSKNLGYMVDITKLIFEKKGHNVVYEENIAWDKAIQLTREGKYTAVIGAYKDDAVDFIFPKVSQGISTNSFFTKQSSSWVYKDISSLKDITIGAVQGYSYGPELDQYIKKYKNDSTKVQLISGNRSIYYNAKKLLYGTIDTMLEDSNVLEYYFKVKNKNIPFKIVGTSYFDDIYIAFSPKNPNAQKYADILSNGMIEIRKNGELNKILSKYSLKDWE